MFKKILVPLDGSEVAETILPYVEDLASTHEAKIVLLRVALAHTLPGQDEIKAEVSVVREAEEYLKGVEEGLKKKGFDVESHVRYGKGAEEIVDFCQEPVHPWKSWNRQVVVGKRCGKGSSPLPHTDPAL
jgi:nucleotide-binding universal stress UspA family protein